MAKHRYVLLLDCWLAFTIYDTDIHYKIAIQQQQKRRQGNVLFFCKVHKCIFAQHSKALLMIDHHWANVRPVNMRFYSYGLSPLCRSSNVSIVFVIIDDCWHLRDVHG